MARVEEIGEHAVEVEINETRPGIQQKRPVQDHFLKWQELLFELAQHLGLPGSPLIDATPAELTLLVPQKHKVFRPGHKFLVIDVVQLETEPFDLVLDPTPQDGLNPLHVPGKQPQFEPRVEVPSDDLGIVADFKEDGSAVANNRQPIVPAGRELPHQ